MSTLKQLQEKGEEDFENFVSSLNNKHKWCNAHGEGQFCHLDNKTRNEENIIPDIKAFLHQQTTLAFEAGKAEAIALVLKEIDFMQEAQVKNLHKKESTLEFLRVKITS